MNVMSTLYCIMNYRFVFVWTLIIISKGCVWGSESPFFFPNTTMDWNKAKLYCESQQGRLVTMDTQSKYEYVRAMNNRHHGNIVSSRDLCIGLFTTSKNCTNYVWLSGKPLQWSKWGPGELEQCIRQQCVKLRFGLFKTAACVGYTHLVMCEYVSESPLPLPTTSLMMTTTETSTDTPLPNAEATTNNIACGCCTKRNRNITQISRVDLLNTITQTKAELSVRMNTISTYRRKRISVYEARPSCMAMGVVALIIIAGVIGAIVVPDLIILCVFLKNFSK
ncbi:low affinity immunoglobulin epsilon Fc receptor-like [Pecten maximus]|uniref:low affinity immunoglobulin epsilon Fc receptor-like n=1 Tax=Pecten maximus TaxID=6579 RepID=UPI001457E910|nr:low affinity immunoglobulin epsilon Fc receptor-like [Pecten maximus]